MEREKKDVAELDYSDDPSFDKSSSLERGKRLPKLKLALDEAREACVHEVQVRASSSSAPPFTSSRLPTHPPFHLLPHCSLFGTPTPQVRAANTIYGRALCSPDIDLRYEECRSEFHKHSMVNDPAPLQKRVDTLKGALDAATSLLGEEGVEGWKAYDVALGMHDKSKKLCDDFNDAVKRVRDATRAIHDLQAKFEMAANTATGEDLAVLGAAVEEMEEAVDDARDASLPKKLVTDAQVLLTDSRSQWKQKQEVKQKLGMKAEREAAEREAKQKGETSK